MAMRSLRALPSSPTQSSSGSLIDRRSLPHSGGHECLGNLAPLLNFVRGVNYHFHFHRQVSQRHVQRYRAPVTRLVRLLDHENVEVAVGSGVAPRPAAEEDNLLRLRRLHNPPDNVLSHVLTHAQLLPCHFSLPQIGYTVDSRRNEG